MEPEIDTQEELRSLANDFNISLQRITTAMWIPPVIAQAQES